MVDLDKLNDIDLNNLNADDNNNESSINEINQNKEENEKFKFKSLKMVDIKVSEWTKELLDNIIELYKKSIALETWNWNETNIKDIEAIIDKFQDENQKYETIIFFLVKKLINDIEWEEE